MGVGWSWFIGFTAHDIVGRSKPEETPKLIPPSGSRDDGLFVAGIGKSVFFPIQSQVAELEWQRCAETVDAGLESESIQTLLGARAGSRGQDVYKGAWQQALFLPCFKYDTHTGLISSLHDPDPVPKTVTSMVAHLHWESLRVGKDGGRRIVLRTNETRMEVIPTIKYGDVPFGRVFQLTWNIRKMSELVQVWNLWTNE